MKRFAQHGVVVAVAVLGLSGAVMAANETDDCTLATLRGTYVFAASGFTIAVGGAQPKAIVEIIEFDGKGALSAPTASRSLNGTIATRLVGSGGYTVESGCIGHLAFDGPGPTFDVFFSPSGKKLWMIQTTPGSVFQGTATRISDGGSDEQE